MISSVTSRLILVASLTWLAGLARAVGGHGAPALNCDSLFDHLVMHGPLARDVGDAYLSYVQAVRALGGERLPKIVSPHLFFETAHAKVGTAIKVWFRPQRQDPMRYSVALDLGQMNVLPLTNDDQPGTLYMLSSGGGFAPREMEWLEESLRHADLGEVYQPDATSGLRLRIFLAEFVMGPRHQELPLLKPGGRYVARLAISRNLGRRLVTLAISNVAVADP